MKNRRIILGLVLVASTLAIVGCDPGTAEPTETVTLANPASIYCQEQGHTLEMRTDENGTYGVCIFDDGSECEEWAYYRGECAPGDSVPTEEPGGVSLANPASVYCEEQGYVLEMRTDANGTYGVCIFPDGSECEEWAFFRGECGPEGAEPGGEPGPDVRFGGVSFSYDDSLATGVTAEIVPAVGPDFVGPWEIAPEHLRFSFDGYVFAETSHEPRILIYPVAGYEAVNERTAPIIDALRQLLEERPAVPERIPFLPPPNGPMPIQIQFSYIDFQNGSGLRAVVWVGQINPVSNSDLFYTFQGLTSDGNTYVSAILPVSHATLPADGFEVPGGDYEAFTQNFETYLSEITQQLGAEDPSSFAPDLALLDEIIQSLDVAWEPAGTPLPPMGGGGAPGGTEDLYEGWETYTSEAFGYTLRYPGDCTVMGADHAASVQFVGPLANNEHWPWFFVDHYDSDFYHPPAGTDVRQWIIDSGLPYDEMAPEIEIAGLPAVRTTNNASPQAYGSDDYYFIKDGQLFHIQLLHAGGQQDWQIYNLFLESFTFP